jgi:phospholipid-binding lipoprotein MlaA
MNQRIISLLCAVVLSAVGAVGNGWCEAEEPYDPIEPVNRGIFWFNDELDIYVFEPMARLYKNNMPDFVQTGVGNFFLNLRYPSYLVSDIIQGKFSQALDHTGRFVVNSTIGVVGLIDVAEDMGLPDHEEDFALALAYHGVPAGPYLVIPFLGPSNVRDGIGLIVDGFLNPISWIGYTNTSTSTKLAVTSTAIGVKFIHTRAGLIQAIEAAKESSVDYYLFLQGAYYQHRHGLLTDGADEEDEEEPVSDDS